MAAHAFNEHLANVRAATVAKLETQREEKRAALLKPKPTADAVAELKAQETRALARQLSLLDLQTRIRLDDGTTGFLEALEGAPPGFPIAPPELIHEAASALLKRIIPKWVYRPAFCCRVSQR